MWSKGKRENTVFPLPDTDLPLKSGNSERKPKSDRTQESQEKHTRYVVGLQYLKGGKINEKSVLDCVIQFTSSISSDVGR